MTTTTALDISVEDLPRWMRLAQRGVNWGLLLTLLLGLAAGWSFLVQPSLPRTNASENYAFLTTNTAQALREGRLYPRWTPHTFGGYGAPTLSYFPPGASYTAGVMQVLFTDDPLRAVRVVFALALCVGGIMMALLVARRSDAGTGILAATLYVFSPYIGLTVNHLTGDLSAALAFALLPALLWMVERALHFSRPINPLLLALVTAGLIMTDPRVALGSLPLLPLLIGLARRPLQHGALLTVFGGIGLGITLAGLYWLPAYLDRDLVRWIAADTPSAQLSFAGLLTPPPQVDLNALLPEPSYALGLPLLVFALLGAGALLIQRKNAAFQLLFLLTGILYALSAVVLLPNQTWLLGVITLCLSIGGSGVLNWRVKLQARSRPLALLLALIGVMALSSPVWLSPIAVAGAGDITPLQEISYEQRGYGSAVAVAGWALPHTLEPGTRATPNRVLVSGYQTDDVNRIVFSGVRGSESTLLTAQTHGESYQLCVNPPIQFTALRAYHPAWRASVEGVELSISRDTETGLMHIAIPGSVTNLPETSTTQINCTLTGVLEIWYDSTPSERVGLILSGLTLVALGLWVLRRARRWAGAQTYDDLPLLSRREAQLLTVLLLGFVIILLAFAIPSSPFSLRMRPGYGLDNSLAITGQADGRLVTSVGLEGVAYRVERNSYRTGEAVAFSVFWRASRQLPEDYGVEAYLLDRQTGIQWLRTPLGALSHYPAQRWTTGQYVGTEGVIQLSRTISPGSYLIVLEVYGCGASCGAPIPSANLGRTLTFFDSSSRLQVGSRLILPTTLTILPAETP